MHHASPPTSFLQADTLAGKTALVTGSSSGIGAAVAVALARAGADVHLHARENREGLAETRQAIAAAGRGGSDFLADLAQPAGCQLLVEGAWDGGPIDIWVNNAGVDVLTGAASRQSFEEKLQALWEVDVRATIALSRMVGRRMQQHHGGTLLNVGWDQAGWGMGGDSGEMFAATKGAVMAFTLSLAKSLAPAVRVNCLAPGWIRTKWSTTASEYWDQRARRESLAARWGTPADVAAAAVFLASPAAAFLNGVVLPVNGGFAGGGEPPTPDDPRP